MTDPRRRQVRRSQRRPLRWPIRRLSAAAAALVVTLGVAGCGGGSSPSAPASSAPTGNVLATQVSVESVVGHLGKPARKRLAQTIGRLVDGWWDAAYLGGTYPRAAASFKGVWPGFTPAAAADAAKKPGLTSNAGIAARIDGVIPVKRVVSLDVLAPKGKPAGVTARIRLAYRTTGQLTGKQSVFGSLSLTPEKGGWKVFAFDIARAKATTSKGGAQ